MNPVIKKNFAVFPVLGWILGITAHIANKGELLVRYYGDLVPSFYYLLSRFRVLTEEHNKISKT